MKSNKTVASISIDLDDKWTYLKTNGDEIWTTFPSYLNIVIPRVLEFLSTRNLRITFFIVGQDAALSRNREFLQSIFYAGHELGNHSFSHDQWLHRYPVEKIEIEISTAEENIESATGHKPIGFRGPGYSWSPEILDVLARREYLYDASSLPTYLGPLARVYFLLTSNFRRIENKSRREIFGKFKDGLRPIKPYKCRLNYRDLMEIPVTTLPIFKLPIHLSYIIYLSMVSTKLALAYFRSALLFCRMKGVDLSLIIHPLDFLGVEDRQGLSFFPAMKLPREKKLWIVSEVFRLVSERFYIQTLQQHALCASTEHGLRIFEPRLDEWRDS